MKGIRRAAVVPLLCLAGCGGVDDGAEGEVTIRGAAAALSFGAGVRYAVQVARFTAGGEEVVSEAPAEAPNGDGDAYEGRFRCRQGTTGDAARDALNALTVTATVVDEDGATLDEQSARRLFTCRPGRPASEAFEFVFARPGRASFVDVSVNATDVAATSANELGSSDDAVTARSLFTAERAPAAPGAVGGGVVVQQGDAALTLRSARRTAGAAIDDRAGVEVLSADTVVAYDSPLVFFDSPLVFHGVNAIWGTDGTATPTRPLVAIDTFTVFDHGRLGEDGLDFGAGLLAPYLEQDAFSIGADPRWAYEAPESILTDTGKVAFTGLVRGGIGREGLVESRLLHAEAGARQPLPDGGEQIVLAFNAIGTGDAGALVPGIRLLSIRTDAEGQTVESTERFVRLASPADGTSIPAAIVGQARAPEGRVTLLYAQLPRAWAPRRTPDGDLVIGDGEESVLVQTALEATLAGAVGGIYSMGPLQPPQAPIAMISCGFTPAASPQAACDAPVALP